jgi:hypothetical protein
MMETLKEVLLRLAQNQTEYWKAVCERDALWEAFCKFPSDSNWDLYAEASMRVGSFEPTPEDLNGADGRKSTQAGKKY